MSDAAQTIRTVHLIFKTHLDVGFTDFSASVVNNYFTSYIPKAIALAEQLRQAGASDRFVWTTGSWLIYEYLEWADSAARRRMETAIANGDIAWHALPFTTHSELMDVPLFRFGLSLSQELDRRFGKRTIAAKMTDVPGHTRGIVPLLAEAGVQFLHIGVNGASTPPDVPPVFRWRDPQGAEVLVMYHKGSYGDLMVVPGLEDAIAFAHTGDNMGPQSVAALGAGYDVIRRMLPGAAVQASTMDTFAARLASVREALPIIHAEIGDTWIHGGGTDPRKVAQYRALLRLRANWLERGQDPDALRGFHRRLLLVPEHTWGLDVKTHLNDFTHYTAGQFAAARAGENYRKMEASWQEQRQYITQAVDALPDALRAQAETALHDLEPTAPSTDGYTQIPDLSEPVELASATLALDPQHGFLSRLILGGRILAGPEHPLARFWYETFSAADYERFHQQYNVNKRETRFWAVPDFTKPGIQTVEHRVFLPRLTFAGQQEAIESTRLLLLLEMPEPAWTEFGAPRRAALEMEFPHTSDVVYFTLQWFGKPACRLPEALWLSFVPRLGNPQHWRLEKLGQWISPLEVVRDGNRHLHAVTLAARHEDGPRRLEIESYDAPLIAPGEPSLLNFTNRQPNLRHGLHVNLYNNLWGTNFPMWYEENAKFRFALRAG